MNDKPFVLNNRFTVYPELGLIKQIEPIRETRIEPRLMNLLCILVAKQGELVSREMLTKEVWNDYGNADEGLTQGISYLRKVFNDDAKTLIETVPKKGYVLRAAIKAETGAIKHSILNKKKVYWVMAIVLLAVTISVYFIFFVNRPDPSDEFRFKQSPDVPGYHPDIIKNKQKQGNSDAMPDTAKRPVQSPDLKK